MVVRCGALEIAKLLKVYTIIFLRQIVGLSKSTLIYTLHAELGRRPILINIKVKKKVKTRNR